MDLISVKTSTVTFITTLGVYLISFLGGWDGALSTLVLFMAMDYITGIMVAGIFQKSKKTKNGALESNAGFKGLCRKFSIFLIIVMASEVDQLTGTDVVRYAVIIGYITNEAISIFENIGLMGLPYPDRLKKAIDVLTERKG